MLIKNKAYTDDAYEALLLRDEFLTEGSASNVFIVDKGVIKTPKLSNQLLPGITRKFLTDLIIQKLLRVKQIEDNHGKTIVSEGVDANYHDIINYSVFALIHLQDIKE